MGGQACQGERKLVVELMICGRPPASGVPKNDSNRVLQPEECAEALLNVIGALTTEDTGSFFDWQGSPVRW